jgi:hypothetical protein
VLLGEYNFGIRIGSKGWVSWAGAWNGAGHAPLLGEVSLPSPKPGESYPHCPGPSLQPTAPLPRLVFPLVPF